MIYVWQDYVYKKDEIGDFYWYLQDPDEKEDHNQFNFSVLMAKLQETPLAKNQKRSQMVKNCQYL